MSSANWADTVFAAIFVIALATVFITALHKGWKPWE